MFQKSKLFEKQIRRSQCDLSWKGNSMLLLRYNYQMGPNQCWSRHSSIGMGTREYVLKVTLFNHKYISYEYNCIMTYLSTRYKFLDLKHCFHWLNHNLIRREDWPKQR
jgi:hypothetical protein